MIRALAPWINLGRLDVGFRTGSVRAVAVRGSGASCALFVSFVHVDVRQEPFYAAAATARMKEPLVLYSTNTWLAYAIAERFYGGVHFAWCSPVYDGRKAAPHVNIPPTSSPAELYRLLMDETERGERHSALMKNNRDGILRGADAKRAGSVITASDWDEIDKTVKLSHPLDFRPVLYVIPYDRVRGTVVEVPVPERAHPLSVEYRVESLPRDAFDMLELRV
jgi:hypothetical protein